MSEKKRYFEYPLTNDVHKSAGIPIDDKKTPHSAGSIELILLTFLKVHT